MRMADKIVVGKPEGNGYLGINGSTILKGN
jgi:hypothetical protein